MLVSGKRSFESAQVGKVLLRREVRRGVERAGGEMMRLRGGEFDWNEIPRFVKGLLTWNRDYPKRNRWILPRNDIIYHWLINTGAGTCMFWGSFFLYAYTWPDIWLPDWDSVPETHKYQFKWGIALMLCALAGTAAGPWIEGQLGAWSDGFVMEFQLVRFLYLIYFASVPESFHSRSLALTAPFHRFSP